MFSVREIGIKLTLKNEATRGLDVAVRDIRSWEKKITSSIFSVKNAFIGLGASMVFRTILKNSDDLKKSWEDYKKSIMDSGVEDALKGIGLAAEQFAGSILGVEGSAKSVGDVIVSMSDIGARGIIALTGAVDRLRQSYNLAGLVATKFVTGPGSFSGLGIGVSLLAKVFGVDLKERVKGFGDEFDRLRRIEEKGLDPGNKALDLWIDKRNEWDKDRNFLKALDEEMERSAALTKAMADLKKQPAGNVAFQKKELSELIEFRKRLNEESRSELPLITQQEYIKGIDETKDAIARHIEALNLLGLDGKAIYEELLDGSYKYGDGIEEVTSKTGKLTEAQKEAAKAAKEWAVNQAKLKESFQFNAWLEEEDKAFNKTLETLSSVYSITSSIYDVMANEVLTVFDDWVEGSLKPARDYLKDIVKTLASMALQAGMKMAFNVAFNAIAGTTMAARGGVFGTAGSAAYPVKFMASGGITNGPEAVFGSRGAVVRGEAGPEAYVPLPGNRKIPVEMKGGGGGNTTIIYNVQAADADSFARMLRRNGRALTGEIGYRARRNAAFLEA